MEAFFANPSALWWGLLAVPLCGLFMLKHRPRRRVIASTLLWKNVSQMQIADAPLSRLRASASLLLNLAALACAVLALAGFRVPEGRERGLPVVIVIDRTAGMRARTPDGTRVELAVESARRVISAAQDSTFTLLGWDGAMLPLAPRDSEASAALRGLANLDASVRGASDALLVDELRRMAQGTRRVVLISDHKPSQLGEEVLWLPAGEAVSNAGIVAAGLSDIADGQAELFFALELHGAASRRAGLILERVGTGGRAEVVDARDVELRQDERVAATFRVGVEGLYRARLREPDALTDDDFAYVRFSARRPLPVRVVGETPANLKRLLDALGMKTDAVEGDEAIIFTSETPQALPRLPAAYVFPARPAGVVYAPERDESAVAARPVASFLWSGAGAPDIRLARASAISSEHYMQPVLDAGEGTVMALVSRGPTGPSDLVIGFPLEAGGGQFSETAAFVVLWSNWFDHVRDSRESLPRGAVAAADSVVISPLEGRGEFRYGLVGEDVAIATRTGAPGELLDLNEPGVYRFEGLVDATLPLLGVSLLDANESNTVLAPKERPPYGDLGARLRALAGGTGRGDIEFQPWLALMALAALMADWLLFRRRYPRPGPGKVFHPLPAAATASQKRTGRV